MTNADKTAYLPSQTSALEDEIWQLDTLASALTKAGLAERAEAIAKQSAEQSRVVKALRETIIE